MSERMKVWSEIKTGTDGRVYANRYLLTPDELTGLQRAGLVGDVAEVIGMQDAADALAADYEMQAHVHAGGVIQ